MAVHYGCWHCRGNPLWLPDVADGAGTEALLLPTSTLSIQPHLIAYFSDIGVECDGRA